MPPAGGGGGGAAADDYDVFEEVICIVSRSLNRKAMLQSLSLLHQVRHFPLRPSPDDALACRRRTARGGGGGGGGGAWADLVARYKYKCGWKPRFRSLAQVLCNVPAGAALQPGCTIVRLPLKLQPDGQLFLEEFDAHNRVSSSMMGVGGGARTAAAAATAQATSSSSFSRPSLATRVRSLVVDGGGGGDAAAAKASGSGSGLGSGAADDDDGGGGGGEHVRLCFVSPFACALQPTGTSFRPLFTALSVDSIVLVLGALLQESKVLLCSSMLSLLTPVAEGLLALLHPFRWPHVYMPLLPDELIMVITAPVPFFVGVRGDWKLFLHEETVEQIEEEAVVVNLDTGQLWVPPSVFPLPLDKGTKCALEVLVLVCVCVWCVYIYICVCVCVKLGGGEYGW